jgi:hypothetical protein
MRENACVFLLQSILFLERFKLLEWTVFLRAGWIEMVYYVQ